MIKKSVGVALSSGAEKGLAHIGVLKVLEEYKIQINFISGASSGAVIAALYAYNPNAKSLEKAVLSENLNKLFDYTLSKSGFIKGNRLEMLLTKKLNNAKFDDLKISLFIPAFDIKKNREVLFTKGNVAKAVRVSISLPGLFIPTNNKNRTLVDGGIIDPVPIDVLKKAGVDITIAINVNYLKENPPLFNENVSVVKSNKKIPSVIENLLRTAEVVGAEISEAEIRRDHPDLTINIDLECEGFLSFKNPRKVIKSGMEQARKIIKKAIRQKNKTICAFLKG